jgi:putative sterol carrier protein
MPHPKAVLLNLKHIHMTFQEINEKITALAAQKGGQGVSFKFAFPTGIIVVTGDGQVLNENADADCTIATSEEVFTQLLNGDLNPMMAVMTGKVKISGDMTVAMKLQNLL